VRVVSNPVRVTVRPLADLYLLGVVSRALVRLERYISAEGPYVEWLKVEKVVERMERVLTRAVPQLESTSDAPASESPRS
jgi:hypothetical protein